MSFVSKTFTNCRLMYVCRLHSFFDISKRSYAKTILGALTGKVKALGAVGPRKQPLPVETDPEKLVNYCCGSNIFKEGEDVKLKDDSEYPEWIWHLRPGPPPPLEEYDPNTKEYWERFLFLHKLRSLRLKRIKQKPKMFVNEEEQLYKLKKLRFRALAYKYDAGFDTAPRWDKKGWKII